MRLINTSTLEFKEFIGDKIPPYAILSHVWSDDEVSYDDYLSGRKQDGYGYQKIVKLCEFAKAGSYDLDKPLEERQKQDWAWIDTCCIDKRSSAELSEAINSMYKWYERAAVCLVFLPDVDELSAADTDNVYQLEQCYRIPNIEVDTYPEDRLQLAAAKWKFSAEDIPLVRSAHHAPFAVKLFLASRWFTRGWTLQELIGPWCIYFYNNALRTIGHCHMGHAENWYTALSLHVLVAEATDIPASVLSYGMDLISAPCIAQKMSWASRRVTTRGEDMAYCLLGLFNVNMPLLYGEGSFRAFERLQLEILARSDDQSLFMWHPDRARSRIRGIRPRGYGLLAPSPEAFRACTDARTYEDRRHLLPKSPITFMQRGLELEITLPRGLRPLSKQNFTLLYPLRCSNGSGSVSCYLTAEVVGPSTPYADGAVMSITECTLQLHYRHDGEALEYVLQREDRPWSDNLSVDDKALLYHQRDHGGRLPRRFKDVVRRWINMARSRYVVKVYFPLESMQH